MAFLSRRSFVRRSACAAVVAMIAEGQGTASAGPSGAIRITEPFHGAVLNHRHGVQRDDGLKIQVSGEAPLRDLVTVNGSPAQRAGAGFTSQITLREKETEIVAASQGSFGRAEHRVRVVWDKHSQPRYRFSIDDNSFFLRDLHSKYGTRFVLNIYYTTEDGFELPQFPDRYKSEWKDSADWLRLAFHAYANKPDRPYQYASAAQLIADLDKVAEQIRRFAGEQTYSPPTVIHWGQVQPAALKPLYERGVRVLSGYFQRSSAGWDVNYLFDDDRSEYLSRHDALMEFENGIVFSRVDIVCNNTPVERIAPTLEECARDPNQAEIMDLFTHEQYFWLFYSNYVPDHFQRLDAAIRWVTEHGYKPVFFHEGFMGGPI